MITLRPYQDSAVDKTRREFSLGHRSVLLSMPTGAGKTPVAAHIACKAIEKGNSVGVIAPAIELVNQAVNKFKAAGIQDIRVIQAQNDNGPRDSKVFVASIQTLVTERWKCSLPKADLLIVDEAHHSKARTHEELLKGYPNAKILGLSATPQRGDGLGLQDLFTALVVGTTVKELTDLGYLVPCKVYAPPRILNSREIAQDLVDAYEQRAPGTKAIVFCSTVQHARETAENFVARGISARWISGASKDREEVIAEFAKRSFSVLVNVNCLVEGFDDPSIETAILARRFTHVGSYLQALGRILRPFPGKNSATAIDLCGSALVHGTPDLEREYSLSGKGISTQQRQAIRQCQQCGGVFVSTSPNCPFCAFKLPSLTRQQAKALGVELEQVTAQTKKTSWPMRAKRHGTCASCNGLIVPGTWILYSSERRVGMHAKCAARAERSAA